MSTVWKYEFAIEDTQRVAMPRGAELLCVQVQDRSVCLWARVDPSAPREMRIISIVGTGETPAEGTYVDTIQIGGVAVGGSLVFHVFDQGEATDAEVHEDDQGAA